MPKNNLMKKITCGITMIAVLAVCLFITTAALMQEEVAVEKNKFQTGTVKINLNDGLPVITENECAFSEGMTITKEFFIENKSTCSVYYKIYLDQVSGGLADVLSVTVRDGNKILYNGTPRSLSRERTVAADDILEIAETRYLTVDFHFPKDGIYDQTDMSLSFNLCADATQTKNNPDKLFE